MRTIVIHSTDKRRGETLATVLNTIPNFTVYVVATTTATIALLTEKKIDTVLIDTDFCGDAILDLTEWCIKNQSHLWRIILREERISATFRMLLPRSHGSLHIPTNAFDLKRFVIRLGSDFPIPREKKSYLSPVKMAPSVSERITTLLSKLNSSTISLEQLKTLIVEDSLLPKIILNRINSPFYGLSSRVTSLERAILLLGTNGTLLFLAELLTDQQQQVA